MRLTAAVRAVLPKSFAQAVTVASWTPTSVVFAAEDPATATALRFAIPDVLRRLKSVPDFATVERTRVRVVRPVSVTSGRESERHTLSESTAHHLEAVAASLASTGDQSAAVEGLRRALKSLAATASAGPNRPPDD